MASRFIVIARKKSMQTLAELKALNAAEEAKVDGKPEPEQVELQDVVDVSEATEPEYESEAQAEDDGEEWLKADEPAAQAVPVAKHVEMKHKLRARLDEKDSELELLRKEIDALKSGVVPQAPQAAAIKVPKLSEYDFDEDAYAEAMADYQSKLIDAKLNGSLNNQRQAEAQAEANRRLEAGLNEHYERAAKLIEAGAIDEQKYRNADARFRQELNVITNGNGDTVADQVILRIGNGSEKVVAHLGVNQAAMSEFKRLMIEDSTGLSAAVYLGGLKSKFASPTKNLSKAPAPDTPLKGDSAGVPASEAALLKKYRESSKAGDNQKAFDLKRAAKAKGINTSNW
jgi:hypothetical protein